MGIIEYGRHANDEGLLCFGQRSDLLLDTMNDLELKNEINMREYKLTVVCDIPLFSKKEKQYQFRIDMEKMKIKK